MTRYVLGRLASTALMFLAITLFVFVAFFRIPQPHLPGLGGILRQATLRHDLPLTAGSLLFLALGIVLVNLVVDLAYAAVDPRIRVMLRE